jgi:hypothetical protein
MIRSSSAMRASALATVPEQYRQPASAPLARPAQSHAAQPDRSLVAWKRRRDALFREQRDLLRPSAVIEDLDRPGRRRALAVVDLAEIQHMPLNHLPAPNAPVLHHRPTSMLLAVLPPNIAAQKRGPRWPRRPGSGPSWCMTGGRPLGRWALRGSAANGGGSRGGSGERRRIGLNERHVLAEQIAHRAMLEPMAVQPPFAARIDQPIDDQGFEDVQPIRALARRRQERTPEIVQAELGPSSPPTAFRSPMKSWTAIHRTRRR